MNENQARGSFWIGFGGIEIGQREELFIQLKGGDGRASYIGIGLCYFYLFLSAHRSLPFPHFPLQGQTSTPLHRLGGCAELDVPFFGTHLW